MENLLIAEISGKRPGTQKQRPTERFLTKYDKVIISNNSDGYITDWEIINVPSDYVKYYAEKNKMSKSSWYAPMNRSYAIKYAKEHGYRYLMQLDDNITFLEISCFTKSEKGNVKKYRSQSTLKKQMLDDFAEMLICVLKNTNAGMAGCGLVGASCPDDTFISERFVYSCFVLDLDRVPDEFQGDFEDDIEYRLKLKQMGVPVLQVAPLKYSKTGQGKNSDLTGCRKAYAEAGMERGAHMSKLYGDVYSCRMRNRRNSITSKREDGALYFKHILKPFKVGVMIKDMEAINDKMRKMFEKYKPSRTDRMSVKTKKKKRG